VGSWDDSSASSSERAPTQQSDGAQRQLWARLVVVDALDNALEAVAYFADAQQLVVVIAKLRAKLRERNPIPAPSERKGRWSALKRCLYGAAAFGPLFLRNRESGRKRAFFPISADIRSTQLRML